MVLLIDCFKQIKGLGKSIGIYNFAIGLAEHMSNYCLPDDKIIVLGNHWNKSDFGSDNVEFVEVKRDPRDKMYCVWWELFGVMKYVKKYSPDKVIFPRGYIPLIRDKRFIAIIHDFIPFWYDKNQHGYFNRVENAYIMKRLKTSVRSAGKVITVSEASKQDILQICDNTRRDRIVVIHNGINYLKCEPVPKKDYIVAVTSNMPHKNAQGIIDAYMHYRQTASDPVMMKVIGISREPVEGIEFIPYIESNVEYAHIIAGARVFLFLSLIEGFGFPPIEAMQLGTPVVCSDISALSEVTGDAAELVDPCNCVAIAQILNSLLNDNKRQQELIARGYQNIKRFDWSTVCEEYWNVLRR